MTVEIMRTGKKEVIFDREKTGSAISAIKNAGYTWIHALDIENWKQIKWDGIEFNNLCSKDGNLYRFNYWLGKYPYKSLEIEEIGTIKQ